ncbi:MAG: hypothetical protein NXI19_11535 [Alphaproteobacteria bacterium]|nr:hypothetical protein [Alphaproteobacteria bacterium]
MKKLNKTGAPIFDSFVGIDWSGAKGARLKGLQVAECRAADRKAPVLLNGPQRSGFWRRADVLDLLSGRIAAGERMLVGIDFAFAYAHHDVGAYFPEFSGSPVTVRDLWRYVDGFGRADDDLYGAKIYAEGSPVRDHYMAPNWKGARYTLRQRVTERVCQAQHTSPHPVFKCIGAANVGTGSLAGMRMLYHLGRRCGNRVQVWPFDGTRPDGPTLCEIFPRLYFKRAGLDPRAWRNPETIDAALSAYGADAYRGPALETEDEADAVVSAAALRGLSAKPELWDAPETRSESALEGWIFGVE